MTYFYETRYAMDRWSNNIYVSMDKIGTNLPICENGTEASSSIKGWRKRHVPFRVNHRRPKANGSNSFATGRSRDRIVRRSRKQMLNKFIIHSRRKWQQKQQKLTKYTHTQFPDSKFIINRILVKINSKLSLSLLSKLPPFYSSF